MADTTATPTIGRALTHLATLASRRKGVEIHTIADVRQGRANEFLSARSHAYCALVEGSPRPVIVYAPKLARASWPRVVGVLAHEYGHALLMSEGNTDHSERECDRVAEALFGVSIWYDLSGIQSVERTTGAVRPRPSNLPH